MVNGIFFIFILVKNLVFDAVMVCINISRFLTKTLMIFMDNTYFVDYLGLVVAQCCDFDMQTFRKLYKHLNRVVVLKKLSATTNTNDFIADIKGCREGKATVVVAVVMLINVSAHWATRCAPRCCDSEQCQH